MCGPNADRLALLSSFLMIDLEVGNQHYKAYLETKGPEIVRVYLSTSVPLSSLYSNDWKSALRLSLAIKFAAFMTQTRGILPYFYTARVALAEVVLANFRENNGAKPMTSETMSFGIQSWLYNRGFTEKDFQFLENIGGTFTKGILLAMATAPQRPKEHKPLNPAGRVIPRTGVQRGVSKFTHKNSYKK